MFTWKALLAACALALAACHRDSSHSLLPPPAPKPRAPVAAPRGSSAEELTKDMVEAASQGKSQLPVALKFELSQRPTVGQPLEIGLALIPRIPASPAIVEVSALQGLKVAEGSTRFEIPSVEAAQVYRHSIMVTPTAEGVLFVNLSVSLTHEQTIDSGKFSLPIIAAALAAPARNPSPQIQAPQTPAPQSPTAQNPTAQNPAH